MGTPRTVQRVVQLRALRPRGVGPARGLAGDPVEEADGLVTADALEEGLIEDGIRGGVGQTHGDLAQVVAGVGGAPRTGDEEAEQAAVTVRLDHLAAGRAVDDADVGGVGKGALALVGDGVLAGGHVAAEGLVGHHDGLGPLAGLERADPPAGVEIQRAGVLPLHGGSGEPSARLLEEVGEGQLRRPVVEARDVDAERRAGGLLGGGGFDLLGAGSVGQSEAGGGAGGGDGGAGEGASVKRRVGCLLHGAQHGGVR